MRAVPVAVTVKVVLLPEQMVELAGCPVIEGAVLMVSVAAPSEVAEGAQVPDTTHLYLLASTAVVAAVNVSEAAVTPE